MTNSDNEDYEVLPSAKSLNLPLGIRCMEVNVQEVDEAVRQFTKKVVTDIISPSWKFPHVTLEKLDVTHVMNIFRAHKALSDNQLYMELMELLIDRLYYAIMTSYQFVNGLEAAFSSAGFQIEDPSSSSKRGSKKRDWDPLEIAKKSLEDKTPKPFHTANIGMLVRQFCMKMMGLENIVLNNIHSLKKIDNDTALLSTVVVPRTPKDRVCLPRHSETQTEGATKEGCESCYIAQNILKIVAEKVDTTLRTFSQADSEIARVRLELRKDALSITQRGALLRWLNALQIDCQNIIQCANMLLDINVKYQDDIRSLKEDMEIKEEHHDKETRLLQQNITEIKEELKTEQECHSKVSKLKDVSITKLNDFEKNYQAKVKECQKFIQERDALQKSLNIAEELNLQMKSNLARSATEIDKLNTDIAKERAQNDNLSQQVRHLSEEMAKAGQEVMKLNEASVISKHYEEDNLQLRKQIQKLQLDLEKHESKEAEAKRKLEEKDSKIQFLVEEIKKAQSQLELLTLYPDLNGPVNTPMKTKGSSCIETMEMQVKSNQIRMEILRAQSERLTTTVTKLRDHMKGQMEAMKAGNSTARDMSDISLASNDSL